MFDKKILRLYFVAGTQDCRHLKHSQQNNLLYTLETALQNGITCFQLREKGEYALKSEKDIEKLAYECKSLCHAYNVPLVLNNDVHTSLKINADGVHIGHSDMDLSSATALCQGKIFLGISNNNMNHIKHSIQTGNADYFASGPIFTTQSKPDAATPVGVDFIKEVRQFGLKKPLVAIGGITSNKVTKILAAGADGIAVISAIAKAADIKIAVKELLQEKN